MTKQSKLISFLQRFGLCLNKKTPKIPSVEQLTMMSIDEIVVDEQDKQSSCDFDLYLDKLLEQDNLLMEKFKQNASIAKPELSDTEN
ncbi:hypothetical protein BpHYR1_024342 [Brachionus plicatilis]|uniref:Uncharacterized protein n=1 Tax=Brachionus plicatilis TaxID=10195 RepID=A0A3M7RZ62_BRAPC|nr:hypothetical protein BpHYR1_024342 [Brachionus plicatilis]